MKIRIILSIVAIVLGIYSGMTGLEIEAVPEFQMTWNILLYMFLFTIIGLVLIVGIQMLFKKDDRFAKNAIAFFFLGGLWMSSTGATSLIRIETISPDSMFIFSFGVGMLVGVGILSLIFKWKYGQTP